MWTPRRLVLLFVAFVAVGATFFIYNRLLGWIDGLPALPEKYLPSHAISIVMDQPPTDGNLDRMVRQAFGEGCKEFAYPIRISVQAQSALLVTDQVDIEPDGRLKLAPFSFATFGKPKPGADVPEINTVHCDVAYVTFDRRVESLSDIGKSKIVSAEFVGDRNALTNDRRKGFIHVVHNHGTLEADDDAVVKTQGPIYFRDNAAQHPEQPQMWTRAEVDITDYQSRPPHIVTARGMNIYLSENALQGPDKVPAKPGAGPKQPVRAIELLSVHMILTLEDDAAFGPATPDAPKRKLPPEEKPRLTVTTHGSFRYDMQTDKARFEAAPQVDAAIPQYVELVRSSKKTGNDVIQCDRLDLQFRNRGAVDNKAPVEARTLDIEEARATGKIVILTSDAEQLHARGTELIYNRLRKNTVLRGEPLTAVRDGHKIQAIELTIFQPDPRPVFPARQAIVRGPGKIWLHDRERTQPVEVAWKDQLLIDKERDGDLITLTGGVAFSDLEKQQSLRGNQIKLWLTSDSGPAAPQPQPAPGAAASVTSRSRPRKLHVIGDISARTAELRVEKTDLMIIWFQEAAAPPPSKLAAQVVSNQKPSPKPALPGARPATLPSSLTAPPGAPQNAGAPRKPLEVSARVVEAVILRSQTSNDLEKVNCFERVHVHQDGEKPGERGLTLEGRTLELTRTLEGDILKITGNQAKVTAQELTLSGPEITFDQRENRASVDGAGRMTLLASSSLRGEQRREPTELEVFWNEKMVFVGAFISFTGNVQAVQEQTRVLCPKMDVYLDRTVSFRRDPTVAGPGLQQERPNVSKVICHRDGQQNAPLVTITETMYEKGRLIRFQRIASPEVTFDNDEGKLKAGGKGEVRILQMGEKSNDPFANPATAAAPTSAEQEMYLTRVQFDDRMEAHNKTQTAFFYRNIQVVHVPTTDPNLKIDQDKLGAGGFSLKSDRLAVEAKKDEFGQSYPSMQAEGHASVNSKEFSGQADVIKYEEGRDRNQKVIFQSTSSAPAALYRVPARGQPPQELLGKTIYYHRKTNEFKVIQAYGLSGQ